MITFQQLCEHLTSNQRNAWFLLEPNLWQLITEAERSLVYEDVITNDNWIRLWYPKEKFYKRTMGDEEYNKLIKAALEKEDFVEITKLKNGRIKI